MARPGKSIEAKLEIIDAKIAKAEAQLKGLKDERKNLEESKAAQEMNELISVMKEKNITIDQIKELIQ